jgi:hypothetical protein
MPYKYFDVEFPTVETLHDLRKPIEVFKRFIEAISEERIRGWNFNKYFHPPQEPHPKISIRINLVSEEGVTEEITRVAKDLLAMGDIRLCDSTLRPWTEPDFVVRAHEAATMCALKFREEFDARPDAQSHYTRDPTDFVGHFIISLLNQLGFNLYIAWTYLRTPLPEYIEEIAEACSQIVSQHAESQITNPDFVERFIHCFTNCTSINFEGLLRDWLTRSEPWQNIAQSRRSPSSNEE